MPDIRVIYQEEGNLPNALRRGRENVHTEYFGFLDDDDIYTAKAIEIRISPMLSDVNIDFVATNGIYRRGDECTVPQRDGEAINRDPLEEMTKGNWLASCGGLYRTATIVAKDFHLGTAGLEWTYLAYWLISSGRKLLYLNVQTYIVNDTPESLSKSQDYYKKCLLVMQRVALLETGANINANVRKAIGAQHHAIADRELRSNNFLSAFLHHLNSLRAPGGFRHIPFSRHFFFPLCKSVLEAAKRRL
jgi:glycosyltransferase involved in cell wall biosynthesis